MGVAFGLLVVASVVAIPGHGLEAFFSLGGLIIVGGGVISAAFMSFECEDVQRALNAIPQIVRRPRPMQDDLRRDLDAILAWAQPLYERGTRALESHIRQAPVHDPFVRYGLNMVVGDHTPDDVRSMMIRAADASYERDCVPVDVLRAMASHAPAFGMVGTLVGMVGMLANLSGDVGNIGSTLAIAFLSTLYGVLSARMIYLPAASRLQQDIDRSRQRHEMITEGMVLLATRRSPMHILDQLSGFLPPAARSFYDVMAPPAIEGGKILHDKAGRAAILPRLTVVGS